MVNFTPISLFSTHKWVIAVACAMACGSAMAQWQWLDTSGHKVYSDTAPPQGTPDKNILKRPKGSIRLPDPAAGLNTPAAAAAPVVVKPSGVDTKLEAKRKEAEQAQEAQRKEADDKMIAARAENCGRAKNAKATIQLGTRIQTVDAKGERMIMDDAARATESKRLDGIIASDCGPMPAKAAKATAPAASGATQ